MSCCDGCAAGAGCGTGCAGGACGAPAPALYYPPTTGCAPPWLGQLPGAPAFGREVPPWLVSAGTGQAFVRAAPIIQSLPPEYVVAPSAMSPEPMPGDQAVVAAAGYPGTNLREDPRPTARLLGQLYNGTVVHVLQTGILETGAPPGAPNRWWYVSVRGPSVFSNGYVRAIGPQGEAHLILRATRAQP